MAAAVRLPVKSQLSLRDRAAGCDACLQVSHAIIPALESRSDALRADRRGELRLLRPANLGRESAVATLREGTGNCSANLYCSSRLESVDPDCTGRGSGRAFRLKGRLLLGTARNSIGGGSDGHISRKSKLDCLDSQIAPGPRRKPSVQARASESNLVVERPAVKGKSVQKKEIYKGLEDSPAKVERCIIVDEDNNVVGEASRQDTVGKRLWGRGVYCLVQNRRGQLLVTQRTEEKDLYPGHLDVVVSGCVNVGEEYSDTIVRELCEELGLKTVDRKSLTPLFLFKWVDEYCRIWGCGYHYVTDCETFDLQVEEVQWCKWMDLDEVEELIQTARFTPVGLCVLRRFLREQQLARS
eukprot:TRINITY_DN6824_c0_g1_i1.p1 TRINITY_DN6824_c0_g1~~TRINITY_DN6824_c0_g1_i1.p1  ORF type:complete len:355 (-),score=35.99 TRINITY_DN6824_c0_g1_i1:396-1460(-)